MVAITLSKGGCARLTELDGERGALQSDTAAAPGSRLVGTVEGGRTVCLKVHRCVRVEESYRIEGRFIDLTRQMRQHLQAGLEA